MEELLESLSLQLNALNIKAFNDNKIDEDVRNYIMDMSAISTTILLICKTLWEGENS